MARQYRSHPKLAQFSSEVWDDESVNCELDSFKMFLDRTSSKSRDSSLK